MSENKELPQEITPASFGCSKAVTILGLAFMALTGVVLYLVHDALVEKPADAIDALKEIMASKGEITVTTTDVSGKPVVMYSLYEKRMAVEYTYRNKWWGSEKSLTIRDEFVCRYGVDASLNGVQASWDSPGVLRMDELQISLISCEPVGEQKMREEGGWWNKLQPEERAMAQNELLNHARRQATQDTAALRVARERFLRLLQAEAQKRPSSPEIIAAPGI